MENGEFPFYKHFANKHYKFSVALNRTMFAISRNRKCKLFKSLQCCNK